MNKVLFDSSAILAIINEEDGFDEIRQMLPYSSISMVNLTEVIAVMARNEIPQEEVEPLLKELLPEVIPFNYEIAMLAGTLITTTQTYGLSLGDRCCVATGIKLSREIYTTDKAWSRIDLGDQCKIKLVR